MITCRASGLRHDQRRAARCSRCRRARKRTLAAGPRSACSRRTTPTPVHALKKNGAEQAAPILDRLLTQLQQAQWELQEDARKQAWDHRHEPRGHEQNTWRLLPALLDGDVFLGIAPQGPAR